MPCTCVYILVHVSFLCIVFTDNIISYCIVIIVDSVIIAKNIYLRDLNLVNYLIFSLF